MPVTKKPTKPREPRPAPAPYKVPRSSPAAINVQPRAGDPSPFSVPIGSPRGPLDTRKIPRS